MDDFRLDYYRYYVKFLIFSPASIVDKTSFINQSAAVLAPFFHKWSGTYCYRTMIRCPRIAKV
ncbi:hypothetical protein MARINON1_52611 [Marinobacter salarius]|nr:hypothetical protein MBHK15_110135 [Marinobacter salarius]VXC29428.1 hypothetical protein MARINON1_52611 [Marinobacter salarius]